MKIVLLIIAIAIIFWLLGFVARSIKRSNGSTPDDNYPMW